MPVTSVKDLVTEMIRDVVGPGLNVEGFRRTGRTFWRDGPEVCQVAHVVMNRWGSAKESSFGVRLGTFWHAVEKLLRNPSVAKMPPPEHRCTFRIDLGRLVTKPTKPPKPEWSVTLKSDIDVLGREVLNDLVEYGLPWFEYRSRLSSALEWKRYARPEGKGTYSMPELVNADARTVFKIMLGRKQDAISDLKRRISIGFRQDALNLAKRLKIPASEITA